MARPVVLPEPFNGASDSSWEQWLYHFENVSAVNDWDERSKLMWLRVRLTSRAQIAFQHLSEEDRSRYDRAVKALHERFEPAARKHRYGAELQCRKKKSGESWAELAEDVRNLVDKAYPEFQEKAKECLALNHYLNQLDHPQLSFGVRQRNPKSLDAAVSATLELESYLPPEYNQPAGSSVDTKQRENTIIEHLFESINKLTKRIKKLEKEKEEPTTVMTISPTSRFRVDGMVESIPMSFLVDTGSAVTLMREDAWKRARAKTEMKPATVYNLVGVGGSPLRVQGQAEVEVQLGSQSCPTTVVVVDEELSTDIILGLDFMTKNQVTIDVANRRITINGQSYTTTGQLQRSSELTVTAVEVSRKRRPDAKRSNEYVSDVSTRDDKMRSECTTRDDDIAGENTRTVKTDVFGKGDIVKLKSVFVRDLESYKIVKCISCSVYRIQNVENPRDRKIVRCQDVIAMQNSGRILTKRGAV